MDALMKMDLYELLQIPPDATDKEIKKAYRKKALSCHPDKNPDNPKAAELFQELSKALEILTDGAARSAYNRLLRARKDAELRTKALDSKRRKLKDELEAREKAAKYGGDETKPEDAAEKLMKEIERLRKEGSVQLEKERELLRQQLEKEVEDAAAAKKTSTNPRLKVKWQRQSKKETSEYTYSKLMTLFQKYGVVTCLVMGKKGNSALVEFSSSYAAKLAQENEVGSLENPVSITWVQGKPPPAQNDPLAPPPSQGTAAESVPNQQVPGHDRDPRGCITNRDYESVVMMRMRQAEERRRLAEQILNEDG